MNKYLIGGAIIILALAGFWYFSQTNASISLGQLAQSDKRPPRDAYPYYCTPDGTVLIIPSVGMSSLLIQPAGGTKFPTEEVLVSHPMSNGGEVKDRYEGDGYVLTDKGEDVAISKSGTSINCKPYPHNDFPSLNFGN